MLSVFIKIKFVLCFVQCSLHKPIQFLLGSSDDFLLFLDDRICGSYRFLVFQLLFVICDPSGTGLIGHAGYYDRIL